MREETREGKRVKGDADKKCQRCDFPPCGGHGSVIEGIRPLVDHMPRTHTVCHTQSKSNEHRREREKEVGGGGTKLWSEASVGKVTET